MDKAVEERYKHVLRLSTELKEENCSQIIAELQQGLSLTEDFPCQQAPHFKTNLFEQWVIGHKIELLDKLMRFYRVDQIQSLIENMFYRVPAVQKVYPVSVLELLVKTYAFKDIKSSLLFNLATGKRGRQNISQILYDCEPGHLERHNFIQGFFTQQTHEGWEGESAFSLLASYIPYDCLKVVNGYESVIKDNLASVWASLLDPITADPASDKSGLARLLAGEGRYGVEVFLKLISLSWDNMHDYASAVAKCLYATHTTRVEIKYRPIDKVKIKNGDYQTYLAIVLSSPSLFEALVIEGKGEFVNDLLVARRQDPERFGNALEMVNVFVNPLSEHQGLRALCLLPEGIELLNQLTQTPKMLGVFIDMGGKLWRRVFISKHEDQYLFLKVYETLPGKQLIRWLVFNQPGLYDVDRYFVTEFRKMILAGGMKVLAEPEDSYGMDESEGQSILYKLLIHGWLLSDHVSYLSHFVSELVKPCEEESSGAHLLEQLSKFKGGQIFLVGLISRKPIMLLLILSHDMTHLKYFSYYKETRTVLGYFSKIGKSYREQYAKLLAATLAHEVEVDGQKHNILGVWVQHDDGRALITKLLEEMPGCFQENSDSILGALLYKQKLGDEQTHVLCYLADSMRYTLLWQILYTLSESLDDQADQLWEGLISDDYKMLLGLTDFPEGIQILTYMVKHYENFRIKYSQDLISKLLSQEGMFAKVFRQPGGHNFWFYFYMHYAPLMDSHTDQVVSELSYEDMPNVVKEVEEYGKDPDKEGNSVLLAWVRSGQVLSVLNQFKKAKSKLIELCIPVLTRTTLQTAVNPNESILAHLVVNDCWHGLLREVLGKYPKIASSITVPELLSMPISSVDIQCPRDILMKTKTGRAILRDFDSSKQKDYELQNFS